MRSKPSRNVPASVRQRLLDRAKNEGRPFSELMQYYAMERFLYRLSKSDHARRFILKGALLLRVWQAPEWRPTMDIDLLGMTSNDQVRIAAQIQEILAVAVQADGLVFDANSIQTRRITESADYEGVRVRFLGALDSARIDMQIDIGFGDAVYPAPVEFELPAMLDAPAPRLLCYSRESAIAEKLDTMLKHAELNSRMKDFYDIWLLSRHFDFEGITLAQAIRLTIERRGTELPARIAALTADFASARQIHWSAFVNRLQQKNTPTAFMDVVGAVNEFLAPVISSISFQVPVPNRWIAPGPWT